MPAGKVKLLPRSEVLSFEETDEIVRVAVGMGVDKVRLTGGEPLMRRDILVLVKMLADIDGITDFAMTTNGVLLARFADGLKEAGLQRVNISLDTVDPQRYREITRGGDIESVLEGIDAAVEAGLTPVKLNCVVERSSDEPDAQGIRAFAEGKGLQVRFIRRMDTSAGRFWTVEGADGGDCGRCSRLRLSCDGMVRPCLFSDLAFSVRQLGPKEALKRAVEAKPEAGLTSENRFYSIGG
jgi:cyclic pyranopterin phosphate synthase